MTSITCLNCGTHFKGNYCSNCGQKATVGKLTWKSLFAEFAHFFTHAEHSFVYTTRSVFTRPGIIVKEFLEGKRVKVHKPVTFVLIWFAIYKLTSAGLALLGKTIDLAKLPKTDPLLGIRWAGTRNEILSRNENLITIVLMAPILALVGWVGFRKTKTSFVERWVALLYGSAYTTIFSFLLVILGFVIKLLAPNTSTGFVNDLYFLIYFFSIAWFTYGFQKVYRPDLSKTQKILIALLMSLLANYMSDVVWYCLDRFIPAS